MERRTFFGRVVGGVASMLGLGKVAASAPSPLYDMPPMSGAMPFRLADYSSMERQSVLTMNRLSPADCEKITGLLRNPGALGQLQILPPTRIYEMPSPGQEPTVSRDEIYQQMIDRAQRHGEESEPDHEIGDLQQAFQIALRFVSDADLAKLQHHLDVEIEFAPDEDEDDS
jgi:hypothetical protein